MGNPVRSLVLSLVAAAGVIGLAQIRAATQDQPVGEKIKKLFATPTPTPHKKHKSSPSPTASPKKKASPKPSPSAKTSRSPAASETPENTASPSPAAKAKASPSPKETPTETPHRRKGAETDGTSKSGSKRRHPKTSLEDETSPSPEESETPRSKKHSPTPSPTPTATETEAASPTPSPSTGPGTHGQVATISSSEIIGYENYPAEVRQLLDRALKLTTENLDYKYGSADPTNGGMDCSGFIYYVLSQGGMKEVPRDASEQYIWVRKAGTFQAVLGHHDDTFELDDLKPGDLLFWSGTYHVDRDPAITHTMIYLGREKKTNQRIMVGSSDGRTYKGQSRFGVSIFDFKVAPRITPAKSEEHLTPTFVGYARIPGLKAANTEGE
jgi:peptidoglycan DL-endopeptidase CwlO